MSIKFDGTLTAASKGNWDSEANIGDGVYSNATPLKGSQYYISLPHVASEVAYLSEDITGKGFESHSGRWRVRAAEYTAGVSSGKVFIMNRCYIGAAEHMTIGLNSVTGGRFDELLYKYRTAGGLQSVTLDISSLITLVDGNSYEFSYHYKAESHEGSDGIFRIWIEDIDGAQGKVQVLNLTNLAIPSSNELLQLRFGVVTNFTDTYTIDVGCAEYSTNGVYDTSAATYWIDSANGAETNDGTESNPWKYADQANNSAKAGDTVKLAARTATTPHRLIDMGQIDIVQAGTVNNDITVDLNSNYLTATVDYSGTESFIWFPSPATSGEYYLLSNTVAHDPQRIYVCTNTAWDSLGMAAMDNNSIRVAGTVGSLSAGEYDYGDNDSLGYDTVYYKPKANETDLSILHFEVPSRLTANDDIILLDTVYQHIKNGTIFGAIGSSILDSNTSIGSVIDNVVSTESWGKGIVIKDSTAYKCTGSWTRKSGETGIHCASGAGSIIGCIAHNNDNDGISFNNGTGLCLGNTSYHNGYEAAGDNSGIEATGTSNAVTICYNTCVGNYGAGILWNQGDITAVTIKNNICAFNDSHGISGAANAQNTNAEVTSAFTYNAAYGNDNNAFYYADPPVEHDGGSTAITPANTVTTDPLFVSASTDNTFSTSGNRIGEDYRLKSGSPCTDTDDVPVTVIVDYFWSGTTLPAPTLQDGCAKSRRGSMGAYRHIAE